MNIPKSNFSEWYNEITKEAKLCDLRYNVKGFVVFMPWSVKTMKIMYADFEKELESTGHKPALFPALIPESNFKKEGEHVEGFVPEVFWVTHAGNDELEEKLAMRPTSETAMYQMYSLWIQGLKDLPLKIYQSCQVWRHETKATKPFIRSREFYWIEAHDVFATEQGARDQVAEDMRTTEKVMHQKFGIPFFFFRRPQWDKFPGALDTFAADTLMPDGRALQLPSTHLLGQNFAKPFDVKYTDEKGNSEYCWQTCYGPAVSRIYAGLISTHGDDKGLVLPFDLAPVQVVVVPIPRKGNEAPLYAKAKELASTLVAAGFRAEADLSENTPGFKFNEWEMKGVPIRIELGGRELENKELTLCRRDTLAKEKIPEAQLLSRVPVIGAELSANLLVKADEHFKNNTRKANTIEELESELKKGGFIAVPFCSLEKSSKPCADKVKAVNAGDVRGTLFGNDEKPKAGEKCIACGKSAHEIVYVARQY